ncbi:MAG TPA: tRNA pseudouridine(38-40) synthase TruA [Bacteroidia bacterium]|jgi:tRNA pseudouridine38-40 synthase
MPRYFARIAYVGTAYNGWQVQENTPRTIQQVLNERISGLLDEKIEFTGCGRTDTGVHAREFYVHFDCSKELDPHDADWTYKFNCMLPKDISVYEVFKVRADAHARYDALKRTYEYYITYNRDPFLTDRAYYFYRGLDLKGMKDACRLLPQYSDFSCFSKSNTQVKTNICKIYEAKWEQQDHLLIFSITADRFLRNMVRAIVGTLLDIGRLKMEVKDMAKIIEGGKRSDAGMSVPAEGLYLAKVEYDWAKMRE